MNKFGVAPSVQQHVGLLESSGAVAKSPVDFNAPSVRPALSRHIAFMSEWVTAKTNDRPQRHKMLAIMEAVYGKALD